MRRILILYAEIMGYTKACIDQLADDFNVELLIIQLDIKKLTPFTPLFNRKNIALYNKSQFIDLNALENNCIEFDPEIIFVSGWMDKDYLKIAKSFKKNGKRVISFLDNQWENTFRQKLVTIFGKSYLHKHFTDIWVSGTRQFEFAKRLGYKNRNIKTGFYSADFSLFDAIYEQKKILYRELPFPKEIIFVGRLNPVKGLDLFLDTFVKYHELWPDWKFKIIGSGIQLDLINDYIERYPQWITHKHFMDPRLLHNEIINAGVFCLPSIIEPWGVVIHEFAIAGFPLLCSDACGAIEAFVKEGYNGFVFQSNDKVSLKMKMQNVLNCSDEILKLMGKRSHEIGGYITPKIWATTAYSFLN